ncbi:bifunctional metallophosphatase/5'-nucleotidase [uncultured Lactobacillus sp.]|uniref:bifunctional metallophosphatase/5'-nucleotidase n=1 Tax=uncultured Lactobacillus sp. TaxID=153152 RepID=UPI002629CAA0|nr:bifunctional metallophosphatase/5'-nucleotidase [uncultured Lactobacillus sp.]
MQNSHHRHLSCVVISFASSALLGLFLTSNQSVVHADTVNQQTITKQNQNPVKVYTNSDKQSKPNNDYWKNPVDYKNDVPVQFLGINDLHGNIDTISRAFVGHKMYQNAGNAARLASYLNNAENDFKSKNPNGTTFRVEAGDMVGASPATSSLLQDEPTMKSLKAMGINIGTLGNHEFDEGLDEFHRIVEGQAPEKGKYNKIEEQYPHENSGLQIVVSNLVNKSDGKVPFGWKPYLIKDIDDNGKKVKVGFIGIETTDLYKLTFAKNIKDYQVLDEAESIAKYDKVLQDQGVHAIVVLAHTAVSTYKGKTSGDAVDILQKLYRIEPNNSVDLYIAAHSHQYANGTVGHTKLVQADKFSMAYDDAIGYIDPKTNDFVRGSLVTHVYPVMSEKNDPSTKSDPKVEAIIKDAQKRTAQITEAPVGKAAQAEDITTTTNASRESAVGDLVVDAQLSEAHRMGIAADFAIINGGGVRSNLKVEKDGTIKWKSAQAVQPFNNQIQVFELTGKQIQTLLNSQYEGNGERYYLVSGMKYVYTDNAKSKEAHQVAVMYDENGKPLDLNKTYRVITSNYLVDSTKELKGAKKVADVGVDTDLFVNYFEHQTAAGNLIKVPVLDRKEYVSPAKAAELIKQAQNQAADQKPVEPTKTETPEVSENTQTNTTLEQLANKQPQDYSQEVYLPVIHNNKNWKVRLLDENGKYLDRFLDTAQVIKVSNKKTINGRIFYQIAGTKTWIPSQFVVSAQKETLLSAVGYIPVVTAHPTWKVRLLDQDGHYVNQYLPTKSSWKVFAKKVINGRLCYRLGNQRQWIPEQYLQFLKNA